MLFLKMTVGVVALAAVNGTSSANIVANSGFEAPLVSSGFARFGVGAIVGEGWVVGSGTVDLTHRSLWLPHSGAQSLDLDGASTGSVYQDLHTVPNQVYELGFWMAGNAYNVPITKRMEVFWNGVSAGVFDWTNSSGNAAAPTWTPHVVGDLLATGTVTRLTFLSLTNSQTGVGWGAAIDDVSVVPVPTASTALSMLAIGGLAARRRRC